MEDAANKDGIIRDYRDLKVWILGMELAEQAYKATASFPKEEMYGLTGQMRRSAASIPANIAEGFGRQQRQSFIQFLRIAQGSLKELETHCELAKRLGYLGGDASSGMLNKCETLGKMMRAFVASLEKGRK